MIGSSLNLLCASFCVSASTCRWHNLSSTYLRTYQPTYLGTYFLQPVQRPLHTRTDLQYIIPPFLRYLFFQQRVFFCIIKIIQLWHLRAAALATWFHLHLPSSASPGSNPKHTIYAFFNLYNWNCNEKRTKIYKKRPGMAHFLNFDIYWPIACSISIN